MRKLRGVMRLRDTQRALTTLGARYGSAHMYKVYGVRRPWPVAERESPANGSETSNNKLVHCCRSSDSRGDICPAVCVSGWGSTMRHRGRTLLQGLLAVFAALIAIGVTPAFAAEPPATSKIVTPNGDGTYTLSLSVTGKSQASQEQSKADVIVVLDTSTSMSEGTGNGTRIQVARQAVNSLAQELLANNTNENPDAVTLSLVTFETITPPRRSRERRHIRRSPTPFPQAFNTTVAPTGRTRSRSQTPSRRAMAPTSTSSLSLTATRPSVTRMAVLTGRPAGNSPSTRRGRD